ncbi:MAG: CinA family protein [Gammaproteobacteria bacterium]|nr:CinA family protein [Gammaproteobacteria bacterium]
MSSNHKSVVIKIAALLLQQQQRLVTAESCSGGLLAAACTTLAGSSAWFEGGFVTYSNRSKNLQLGVSEALLASHGAVSEAVALAMVNGAVERSFATVGVAVTGIAGPEGGTLQTPVGTVYIAWHLAAVTGSVIQSRRFTFAGSREAVRQQSVATALGGLHDLLQIA